MSKVYTQAEVDSILASMKDGVPITGVDVLTIPKVLKLQSDFSDLLKRFKVLKEHRLICPEEELETNANAIDRLRGKMLLIDEELHRLYDIWISWKTGEIMTWDQKHPQYKMFVVESQRAG